MNELRVDELAGSITAVPVVSMQSFERRSPFVVPEDGKNLNRSFPGTYDGTYTDALARGIFDELIAPADVLIDLHGGDLVEALEPFTIYGRGPAEEQARSLAVAFGLPYVVRQEPSGGLGRHDVRRGGGRAESRRSSPRPAAAAGSRKKRWSCSSRACATRSGRSRCCPAR